MQDCIVCGKLTINTCECGQFVCVHCMDEHAETCELADLDVPE